MGVSVIKLHLYDLVSHDLADGRSTTGKLFLAGSDRTLLPERRLCLGDQTCRRDIPTRGRDILTRGDRLLGTLSCRDMSLAPSKRDEHLVVGHLGFMACLDRCERSAEGGLPPLVLSCASLGLPPLCRCETRHSWVNGLTGRSHVLPAAATLRLIPVTTVVQYMTPRHVRLHPVTPIMHQMNSRVTLLTFFDLPYVHLSHSRAVFPPSLV